MRFSPRLVLCTLVALLVAASAHGQAVVPNTPTSGAQLSIIGTLADGTYIDIVIYDSQIHSGTVQAVPVGAAGPPSCTTSDAVVMTDAYVLQGGSSTGCDPGDTYEVTDNNPVPGAVHQIFGAKDITKSAGQLGPYQLMAGPHGSVTLTGSGFHIETHYCINTSPCAFLTLNGSGQFCNTSGSICTSAAGPDTGFLTVVNNTGQAFTGTITLQGNSPLAGAPFCPVGGVALDNATFPQEGAPLAAGSSVTLALGSSGSPADSSNCGGFNYDQSATLTNNSTIVFQALNDDFEVECFNCNTGDTATWRPVPVPQSLFTIAAGSPVGLNPPEKCIPYADFSGATSAANPFGVCVLFQTHCHNTLGNNDGSGNCNDAENFSWLGTFNYIIDANTIPNPIGGVHFLGDPGTNCAASLTYTSDTVISYTGARPGVDPIPPQHSGSGGGLNCFVTTYEPSAPAIPVGTTVSSITGFFAPVVNDGPAINTVKTGQTIPLKITATTGAGGSTPLTNLNYCNNPSTPASCTYPWVAFVTNPSTLCGSAASADVNLTALPPDTNSGFQNLGNGQYQFNWQTKNITAGQCIAVSTVYNGLPLTAVTNGGNAVFSFTH